MVGMTVCIAAICDRGQAIVSCADRLISVADSSVSGDSVVIKGLRFHGNWVAMIAGNDVSSAEPMLRSVAQALPPANADNVDEMMATFRSVYRAERVRRAEGEVLSSYGM